MIATPQGETAIEDLTVGRLVTVIEKGINVARPIKWIGGGKADLASFDNHADAYPVRIRKHAFAENSPARDLLVTSEHCLLTEAGLTPIRMLVNRTSIIIDRSIFIYDFHHIKLETHGILLAEGLMTESYLDTGNRNLFINHEDVVAVCKELTIAAPLTVARAIDEPHWNRLLDRGRALGLGDKLTINTVTNQPELRVLLDMGVELTADWHEQQHHMFHIPKGTRPIRLLSRSSAPSEAIGPFVDDRRRLGVAVAKLVLRAELKNTIIPNTQLTLDGWHDAEGTSRWTNGNAAIDLPQAGSDTILDFHLAGTAVYLLSSART